MTELRSLGIDVMLIVRGRRRLQRHASDNLKPVPFESEDFLWIVRDQTHLAHTEIGEDLRADAVIALVDRQPERKICLDRVGAAVLQLVGTQLISEADAAALLA